MHRVSFGFAIFLELLMIFVAIGTSLEPEKYHVDSGKIWGAILINFIFITIHVVKIIKSINDDAEYDKFIEEKRLKSLYVLATSILYNSNSTIEERKEATEIIKKVAKCGFKDAIKFLEENNIEYKTDYIVDDVVDEDQIKIVNNKIICPYCKSKNNLRRNYCYMCAKKIR